ncbi:MAG: hypothetical protein CTY35_03460 [Methylotenera sp.]|nr:MAG: hypothetical protein CTY35_03460 [Methylotenera sp.]
MAAQKPESRFSSSINKLLPLELHYEKMNNPYRSGTADFWYSGTKADLWVEYKYLPKVPSNAYSLVSGNKPALSVLQQKWLKGRHKEGRRVAVIVGTPSGAIILEGISWADNLDFSRIATKKQVAEWIVKESMYERNPTPRSSRKNNDPNV